MPVAVPRRPRRPNPAFEIANPPYPTTAAIRDILTGIQMSPDLDLVQARHSCFKSALASSEFDRNPLSSRFWLGSYYQYSLIKDSVDQTRFARIKSAKPLTLCKVAGRCTTPHHSTLVATLIGPDSLIYTIPVIPVSINSCATSRRRPEVVLLPQPPPPSSSRRAPSIHDRQIDDRGTPVCWN